MKRESLKKTQKTIKKEVIHQKTKLRKTRICLRLKLLEPKYIEIEREEDTITNSFGPQDLPKVNPSNQTGNRKVWLYLVKKPENQHMDR